MKQVKKLLAEELGKKLGTEVEIGDIEVPDNQHGDFAYPCMKAAAELGKNPRQVAEKAAEQIDLDLVRKTEVAGPGYLNFYLDKEEYARQIFKELEGEHMGVAQREGRALVEFSSPNLAKPMHIGHFRNNALGDSIQRILQFTGYDVTSENYLGDWGTQYGKVIYAFKEYGSMEEFEENPMKHMYDLYVKFHDKADEEMEEKGREWSNKIEEGDEEARQLWNMFREATIEYHKKDYERMNIEFDRWTGESTVVEEGKEVVEEGLEKGIFTEDDDGSVYVDFEDESLPNTVVRRSDGTTLYLTRDIANIRKREEEGFNQNLYIVATEQNLHFKQLFQLAEEFNITDIKSEHVSYGLLSLKEGSMSSREGNVIELSKVLDKAVEKAEEIEEREVGNAEAVGIGAVKYANLAVSRNKDISFDWEQVLSFEGDSGPYLQYSNTRAKSILRKADVEGELKGELNDQEYQLVKKLGEFPEKVENAAESREPAKIANYLSTLCEEFNSFYHNCPVLGEDQPIAERRLKIVESFTKVTDQGLTLLGIEPLEEM